MAGLIAAAFGQSNPSNVHRAQRDVTIVTAVPAGGPQNLATLVITVAAPSPTPSVSRDTSAIQKVFADASALAADGIPSTALDAYRRAAGREDKASPGCDLSWPLLAAIGRVESDHGRANGAVLDTSGESTPHIVGIALNGHGTALIYDSDGGRLDHDKKYDHAIGPMQFIPTTWAKYGVDVRGRGHPDPFNIFDAAAAAAHYLCVAGGTLTTLAGQTRAIRAYNASDAYVKLVLATEAVYARGVAGLVVPTVPPGTLPKTRPTPIPPVDPGTPPGLKPTPPSGASPTPDPTSTTSTSVVPTSADPSTSPSASPDPTDTGTPSSTPPSDSAPAPPTSSFSPSPVGDATVTSPPPGG